MPVLHVHGEFASSVLSTFGQPRYQPKFRNWRAAGTIRRIYQNMCQAANGAGYPRGGSETPAPFEYEAWRLASLAGLAVLILVPVTRLFTGAADPFEPRIGVTICREPNPQSRCNGDESHRHR